MVVKKSKSKKKVKRDHDIDLDIVNFDNMGDDDDVQYNQNNALLPQHPFRMLISGRGGCGKTNMTMNLIYKMLNYDKLYILTKHPEQKKYRDLIKNFEDNPDMIYVGSTIEEIPAFEDLNEELQNLIVFDDFVTDNDQKPINDLYVRARHKNCSLLYLTQSYFATNKILRMQCNYLALFESGNRREMLQLYQEVGGIDKDKFMELFEAATKSRYNFFLIDKHTNDDHLRFRQGFNQIAFL